MGNTRNKVTQLSEKGAITSKLKCINFDTFVSQIKKVGQILLFLLHLLRVFGALLLPVPLGRGPPFIPPLGGFMPHEVWAARGVLGGVGVFYSCITPVFEYIIHTCLATD